MDSVRRADALTVLEQAVQAARLDMIFGNQPLTLSVSVALAAIVVGVLWPHSSATPLFLWFGALVGISGARSFLYLRYRRERRQGTAQLSGWERRFGLGCLLAGCAWGSVALLLFPSDFVLQAFLAFVLAGVSSGAMAELSVAPTIARAFIIPCVTPLALRFLMEGDALHAAMGIMAVMYVALVTFAMRRGEAQLRESVAAQLDANATRRELSETTQRVDVMKVEFFSVVSHELRTPLTALRGALGLLGHDAQQNLTPAQRQLLDLANRNIDRLGVIINDLLDMERIESGALKLNLMRLPVRQLIERALISAGALAATHEVRLKMGASDAGLHVIADEERFLQVMWNLLSNAVKFSRGGACVEVIVLRADSHARIEVRDHGPGIPEAMQPYIFSKFCQGDASDSRPRGGTGLGLAITKALVEQMRGTIGYDTKAGSGTTFHFQLPLSEAQADHA